MMVRDLVSMRTCTLLGVVFLVAAAACANDGLLRRLAGGADEDAVEAWEALAPAERVSRLRAGLRSRDPEVAYVAARAASASCLSLDEVRLQASILARRPEWVRNPDAARPAWADLGPLPVGTDDLPAIWKAARALDEWPAASPVTEFHRALTADLIPALVAELPHAGPAARAALVADLASVASLSDAHHHDAARGFLPTDAAADVDPSSEAAFWALASDAPRAWVLRWADRIAFDAAGVPRLRALLAGADEGWRFETASRVARALAACGAREDLRALAAGEDVAARYAAAELALAGEPARFREMRELGWPLESLEWRVDPKGERRRWYDATLHGDRSGRCEDPRERRASTLVDGIVVPDEELDAIGAALLDGGHALAAARYFTKIHPDGLTPAVATRLAGLVCANDDVIVDWAPGALEAVDRAALVRILEKHAAWPEDGLELLARLGEARRVPEMLASWEGWDRPESLGYVRRPEVERFLVERAKAGNASALATLAVYDGLPEILATELLRDPTDAVRAMVLRRDPVGAALAVVAGDPSAPGARTVARLGLVRDPRAAALLRGLRDRRELGRYWEATAGLALAGDDAARAELGGLMRDGRTWLLDALVDGTILTMGGAQEWVDFWVSRLDTNCCMSFQACAVLRELYPTIPLENGGTYTLDDHQAFVRAWLRTRTFRESRLAGGRLPAAPY
jgi:hypothetical protein